MKVFLSWSKEPSRQLALALRDWLPDVLQEVEPWMSEDDLGKGTIWAQTLNDALNDNLFGLLCLTPGNLDSKWMLYEAGALSRSTQHSFVVPVLLGLEPGHLEQPLASFNGVRVCDKDDVLRLVRVINNAAVRPLAVDRLYRVFDRWWPQLQERVNGISLEDHQPQHIEPGIAMDEVLTAIRSLSNEVALLASAPNPSRATLKPAPTSDLVAAVRRLQDLVTTTNLPANLSYYIDGPARKVIIALPADPVAEGIIERLRRLNRQAQSLGFALQFEGDMANGQNVVAAVNQDPAG